MPDDKAPDNALDFYTSYVEAQQSALGAYSRHLLNMKGLPPEARQRFAEYMYWNDALLAALIHNLEDTGTSTAIKRH